MQSYSEILRSIILAAVILMSASKVQASQSPGLTEGQLRPCPDSPNCVSTEYPNDQAHYSEPVKMPIDADSQSLVKEVVKQMGGTLVDSGENYLAFTFTSRVFRFVDNFEIRLDPENSLVHIRSASRMGYSDFGVNRKRVERFKAALKAAK